MLSSRHSFDGEFQVFDLNGGSRPRATVNQLNHIMLESSEGCS